MAGSSLLHDAFGIAWIHPSLSFLISHSSFRFSYLKCPPLSHLQEYQDDDDDFFDTYDSRREGALPSASHAILARAQHLAPVKLLALFALLFLTLLNLSSSPLPGRPRVDQPQPRLNLVHQLSLILEAFAVFKYSPVRGHAASQPMICRPGAAVLTV